MKSHLLVTIMALVASTAFASAESNGGNTYQAQLSANSASQAVANANAGAGAVATGGNVTFNTPANTSQRIHQSGTTTIRSAPQVVAPSMSSGHPCAWSPVSLGISVVGFGGAIGGQRIDDACLIGQMQYRDAAMIMIAGRNPAACRALEAAGNIRAGTCPGSRRASAAVYAAPAGRRVTRVAARTNGQNCRMVQATASTQKKVCG